MRDQRDVANPRFVTGWEKEGKRPALFGTKFSSGDGRCHHRRTMSPSPSEAKAFFFSPPQANTSTWCARLSRGAPIRTRMTVFHDTAQASGWQWLQHEQWDLPASSSSRQMPLICAEGQPGLVEIVQIQRTGCQQQLLFWMGLSASAVRFVVFKQTNTQWGTHVLKMQNAC